MGAADCRRGGKREQRALRRRSAPLRASLSRALGLLALILLLGACAGRGPSIEVPPEAPPPPALSAEEIHQLLGRAPPILIDGVALGDVDAVRSFYAAREHRPAFTGIECARRMPALAEALAQAAAHGLNPADYHLDRFRGAAACAAANELLASDAWLRLAQHLHAGRIDPRTVEPDWTATRPELDRATLLTQALAQETLAASIAALAPQDAYYRALQAALALWRERAQGGNWPVLDSGPTLRPGDRDPRVRQLRERLAAEGYLAELPAAADPELYDGELAQQLRRYQQAAHLDVDGAVGRETLAELTRSPAERVAQLAANLERWRWLPDSLGERHIRVNIADFQLEARAGGRIEAVHRIIVGKQLRRTPSFSASMRYIVVNPWWEVPRRLAVEDKLPLFQREPEAVQRLGFQVLDASNQIVDPAGIDWNAYTRRSFPFRLRQQPGPENALGKVKLMFPNRHDVYLHDTPGRTLFERSRRNFSSGCMRVEHPLALAAWALADSQAWPLARLEAIAASQKETSISLKQRVPVHVQYLTAVVDAGEVRFVYDLYQRDAALIAALQTP